MAGSALATSAAWQRAAAHQPVAMPRDRAPDSSSGSSPTLPLLCIFFAILSEAHSSPTNLPVASTSQLYVVCKNQHSNTCVTWLLDLEKGRELSNELTPFNRPSEICGLSDLKPILPHRKFILVTPFDGYGQSKIFCKSVNVLTEGAFHLTDFTGPLTSLYRERRQAAYSLRGRYRGQTQSQYLAIDEGSGKDEGKAEAHSAADSSRASVSGNSGMGQAQSQTIYDPSCEECYGGRGDMEASNLRRPEQDNYGRGSPGPGMRGQGGDGDQGGQGIPGQGNMGGQRIPGQGGMGGQRIPGQGGMGGQGIPGQGGMGGRGIPGQGNMGGQGIPGQGNMGGQGIPGRGNMGGQGIPGQGLVGGQGIPGQGNMGGRGIPGQGNIGGLGIPGQGNMGGQGIPGQGNMGGQGIPGQGEIGGQGIPGHGNMGSQGIPGQGNIVSQGIPGQGNIGGQGIPGLGHIGGQGIPGQSNMGGQGIPGQGNMGGQGIPGQGNMGGQGIPGQGEIGGQGIPGHGNMGSQGIPGQGNIVSQGIPGQGNIGGQGIPGLGHIGGQGIPGQSNMGGQGIPGQGNIGGQGIPGQGNMGGQVIPGQGNMGGQGIPGHGNMGGQGITGQSNMGGQGIPGQGNMGGQGIPGRVNMGGQGVPGQGNMGGQGIPGPGIMGGQGIPGQGNMGGQGIPGQGNMGGQGIPGQSNMGGQGIPGEGYMGGQGIPGQGNMGGQVIPGQGNMGGQVIPGQGNMGGQVIPGRGNMGGQVIPGQGNMGGQVIPGHGNMGGQGPGHGQLVPGQGGIGGSSNPNQNGNVGMVIPSTKWPLATGPIRGADGLLYYCCVVNPNQVAGSNTGGVPLTPGGSQGYYPNLVTGSNTSGVPQNSGGRYGHTDGMPQITGTTAQQPHYGNDGNGHPSYPYGSGATGQTIPAVGNGQQPNYGNGPPGPPNTYGIDGVQPHQYGQAGGTPSIRSSVQLQPNAHSSGNGPYDQSGNAADNGRQGPNYTYGSDGNVQASPGGTSVGSQVPTFTGQGGQYGPDYNYGSGGTGQSNVPGIYGQTGGSEIPYGSGGVHHQTNGRQPNIYSQGGNGQQQPTLYGQDSNGQPGTGYNFRPGGSGQPNLSGTYGQKEDDFQTYGGTGSQPHYGSGGNGQQSPNYIYNGNEQPNVGGMYGQGSGPQAPGQQNIYGQDGNVQQGPVPTYGQGGQPTTGGTYGQSGGGPQTTYSHGVNGKKGPNSTIGSEGSKPSGTYGSQTPGDMGSQNSYQNGENVQQGNDYNNPEYGGRNKGQSNNGYGPTKGSTQNTDYGGEPQNVMDPNSIIEENDDSQALASVYQGLNGTTASASSQGGNERGHAQTNVQGTYTDSGSFSAQASISDENKGAESQVSGSKKGATSNAEGRGRKNKSQAAVKLGSETGSIQTESQSGGNMHSSNTQVQGSVKGGVADAQARGPGSTSSQAQIGFTPYKEGDKAHDTMKAPFEGGGTASAQSSGRMGTSQSQLRGTFKYGITYNGAAQAGASLDKDAVFSNFTPFDKIDVFDQNNTNINVNAENTDKPLSIDLPPDTSTSYEGLEKSEENTIQDSNVGYDDHSHYDHHKPKEEVNTTNILPLPSNRRAFPSTYDNNNNGGDYDYNVDDTPTDEYDVEEVPEGVDNIPNEYTNYDNYGREAENTHQSQKQLGTSGKGLEVRQTTGGNTQHILLGSLKNQDAKITQIKSERPDESKVYQPGERVPGMGGYTIPAGFTGSVKSVSSKENTYVVGTRHSPSQAQTVTLTPGSGKVKYTYPDHYGRNNINPKNLRSLHNSRADDNRYVSVSKSVTRDLDSENNVRKQYSHTYYTKSSSCGYFTFTCTMVSSAEGKKKVCRPKLPTNPDGTPMRC